MDAVVARGAPGAGQPPAATLKPGAIGFFDALVIGLAATSPAYSLAAVLGPIVALVGVYAPGALLTVGLDDLAGNQPVVMVGSVALILLMRWLCVLGTEPSARVQKVLILAQVGALLAFAVVALVQVSSGEAARRGAIPAHLGRIHPRYRTPDTATWWVAGVAIAWYLALSIVSENALFDSLTALSLLIAFYYALTGVACALYYRRHLTESLRNLVLIGVGPVVGSALLVWLLVESVVDMADPENSYTGQAWLGVGPPLVIGVAVLAVGVILLLVSRARGSSFWSERAGVADPALVRASREEDR